MNIDMDIDMDIETPDELVPQESCDGTNANSSVTLPVEDVLRLTTVQQDEDASERDFQNVQHTTTAKAIATTTSSTSTSTTHTKSGRKTKRTKSGGSTKLKRAVKNEKKSVDKVVQAVIQNYEESPSSLGKKQKQSKVTTDSKSAGAIAVFPSDSEHDTQRRSVTNHRSISDADSQDEEAQIQPTTEYLDSTLEEVPEPPQSQVIHAVATYKHQDQNQHQNQQQQQQHNVIRSVTEGTTASDSRDTSRDTITVQTMLQDSESGTVTARAISSETYYEEIRQELRQEAVAAVAVVSLNDDDPLKDTKTKSDRKFIQEYAWFGCCLGLVVIVVVIVFTTYRNKFNKKEPENFEECGEDTRCYMQLLWNSDLGSYWQKRIARILPRSLLEALLLDTNYSSPRQQAFYYLVKNGNNLYGVDNMVDMGNEELDHLEAERVRIIYALVTFYLAMGGDNWIVNTDWLNPDVDVCSWYGVHCIPMSVDKPEAFPSDIAAPPPGDLDDDTENVDLSWSVEAKAPWEKFWLHSLILNRNNMWGEIPSEIMLLSNMNGMLQLSENSIFGLIPPEITILSHLEGFDIHENKLETTIPPGMSGMTDLRVFDISNNHAIFGNPIPFQYWEKMENLQLQGTKLRGEINSSFCDIIETRESGDVPFQFKYSDDFVLRATCSMLDCPCCTECCKSVCTVNDV